MCRYGTVNVKSCRNGVTKTEGPTPKGYLGVENKKIMSRQKYIKYFHDSVPSFLKSSLKDKTVCDQHPRTNTVIGRQSESKV